LPCRIDALLWGMLAAYVQRTPEVWKLLVERRQWLWAIFSILGAGICAASFSPGINIHSRLVTTIGYDWLDVFYLVVVLLVLVDAHSWLGNAVRRRCLVHLGTISYALYLIHYSVYGLSMGYLLGHSGPVENRAELYVALFAVALAIGLATLSWEFLEQPILSGVSFRGKPSMHPETVISVTGGMHVGAIVILAVLVFIVLIPLLW
jgi:peptidoglycan/LPS O-acetylase OafA/YrhL